MKQPKRSPYRDPAEPRPCMKCKHPFTPNRGHQRFCSIQCKNDYHTAERQEAFRLMREAAAELQTTAQGVAVRVTEPIAIPALEVSKHE